jgi:hypothetical protein
MGFEGVAMSTMGTWGLHVLHRRFVDAAGRRTEHGIDTELERDALTVPAGVSYDSEFEGVETKGLSRWTRKP